MAAWGQHEDGPWVETRSALGQHLEEVSTPLPTPCPRCNHATLEDCSCEPFPTEVWTFFDDEALGQLIIDVMAEIGRRKIRKCVDGREPLLGSYEDVQRAEFRGDGGRFQG